MASVWFSILVAIFLFGNVFAATYRDCSNLEKIIICDECFRCGGTWCNDPFSWPRCLGKRELEKCNDPNSPSGRNVNPRSGPTHYDKFISVNAKTTVVLDTIFDNPVKKIVNSSIGDVTLIEDDINDMIEIIPYNERVDVKAKGGFCPADGKVEEYLTVKILDENVGNASMKVIKFAVPCACNCSSEVEMMPEKCSKRGNYSCNVCICQKGWSGRKCEIEDKEDNERGDLNNCETHHGICAGNGECINGRCKCFDHLEGSQYFDQQCMNVCQITNLYHDTCVINRQDPGQCNDHQEVYIDPTNCTRLAEKDNNGKKIWVVCEEEETKTRYMAMKTSGIVHLIFPEGCPGIAVAQAATVKVTVPAVLGVLAIIATAAAVAGYMVWKKRTPALPLNNPGYSNIDAEDCTGINPLYKPPTSSFKNPTYGKW